MRLLGTHGEYDIALWEAPLTAGQVDSLAQLLGHKGEPWLEDIRRRYAGQGLDFCLVALHADRPVSHLWIGPDAAYPRYALLGHVFTLPEHRRKGLARLLLETALADCDSQDIRLLVLGVDNPAAATLYEQAGFVKLGGPDAHGHQMMIRGAGASDVLSGRWPAAGGKLRREPLRADWYASAVLLLNAFSGEPKLPSLEIVNGHEAELKLLEAMQREGIEGHALGALVDEATGCLAGVDHACPGGRSRYTAPGMTLE